MKRVQYLAFLISVFIFTGCGTPQKYFNQYINNSVDFSDITNNLVTQLDQPLQQYVIPSDMPVLVSDFVNLDTLANNSKLGFLLADLVKNDLITKYRIAVREIKLSRDFMLGKSGFKMLSNKVGLVHANVADAAYALIGTYTFTAEQIIISLKIIDVRTGLLVGSSNTTHVITAEIMELDSTQNAHNIYAPTVL